MFDKYSVDKNFIRLVRSADNNEQWAKEKLSKMFQKNDPNLMYKLAIARIKIYQKAAYNGDSKAQYWYGLSQQGINNDESLKFLIPLATSGNVDAMVAIASGYGVYGGYGVNEQEEFRWLERAAMAGDLYSQNQVALKYMIEHNYEKAYYWYECAARQGSAPGYCGMAECLEYKNLRLYRMGKPDAKQEIDNINKKMEAFYNKALDYVRNRDEDEAACRGIAGYYRSRSRDTKDIGEKNKYLKRAIFYYVCSYSCGNPYGLKYAQEIERENGFKVDYDNIRNWAQDVL